MTLDAATIYPVIRGLLFIALLLLVGTQTASWIIRRRVRDASGEPSRLAQGVIDAFATPLALLLLVLAMARAAAQIWSLKDPSDSVSLEFVRDVLLEGTWGTSWLLQSAAAMLLLVLSLLASRRWLKPATLAPWLILLALWAQTGMGHAASSFWGGPLGRILQLCHLIGGGVWLGTLGVLAVAVFPALRGDDKLPQLAGVLRDFSLAARIGASLVVLAGLLITLKYAGSVHAFLAAPWGRLLMVKVAGLGGVAGLGWYNWRIVTPAVTRGDSQSATQLRRAVRLELALGLVMLGITAFLVATQLPREA